MTFKIYIKSNVPLKKVGVFSLANEPSTHHDGLETLPFNGPQATVCCCLDSGRTFAVVQDGQLAEYLARSHRTEVLVLAGHFHSALC